MPKGMSSEEALRRQALGADKLKAVNKAGKLGGAKKYNQRPVLVEYRSFYSLPTLDKHMDKYRSMVHGGGRSDHGK